MQEHKGHRSKPHAFRTSAPYLDHIYIMDINMDAVLLKPSSKWAGGYNRGTESSDSHLSQLTTSPLNDTKHQNSARGSVLAFLSVSWLPVCRCVPRNAHTSGWDSDSLRAERSGIESRWGRDFAHPSRSALGPTQPPIRWGLGIFPGDKSAGPWLWPPTPI